MLLEMDRSLLLSGPRLGRVDIDSGYTHQFYVNLMGCLFDLMALKEYSLYVQARLIAYLQVDMAMTTVKGNEGQQKRLMLGNKMLFTIVHRETHRRTDAE